MHTAPAIPAQEASAPAPAQAARPLERQMAMLAELGEAALRMALEIERRCVPPRAGQGASEPAPDEVAVEVEPDPVSPRVLAELTLAFYRAARAMRTTVALQARLLAELHPSEVAEAAPQTLRVVFVDGATGQTIPRGEVTGRADADQPPPAPAAPIPAASPREIGAIVGQVARAGLQPGECNPREAAELIERLTREAVERLEDETEFDEVMRRPVSEIVERICRDLGLSPDWPRLAEEDWARAEVESGAVGRPLAPFTPSSFDRLRMRATETPSNPDDPRSPPDPHPELVEGRGASAEPPARGDASPPWQPRPRPKPH